MTDSQPSTLPYNFDPELAEMAALVAGRGAPTDAVAAREESTAMFAALPQPDVSGLDIENREIPGPEGDPPIPVRVYVPHDRADTPTPAILYIHGGGFFVGSIDMAHSASPTLARELCVVVVSVQYRLPP